MTELTEQEIIRAATNDAALSNSEVTLGDRTFKIVDLEYDDYVIFITKLAPLLKAIAGGLASSHGINVGDKSSQIDAVSIVEYCSADIPELARIVCKQTEPSITVKEVKQLGKTPFKLASVVLKQIEQNRIIADISDFFVQMLPLLKTTMGSKLTTKATR